VQFFRLLESRQESPSKSRQRPNVLDITRHRAVCHDWRLLRCSSVGRFADDFLLPLENRGGR
jgi:hypothetical protein